MAEYRERAGVPVLVGVGAAFDFFTGRTRQAPSWMREHGFEWLFPPFDRATKALAPLPDLRIDSSPGMSPSN